MTRKISIKGAIISNDDKFIYDMFEMDATTPRMIEEQLAEANGEDVIFSINSGGGSVFDASEIYTAIKNYEGKTEAQIVGLAASAASFIALASDKTVITPTGQMMIHNASMITMGDYNQMAHAAEMLEGINKTIANAYKLKCGMEEEELLALMNKETWITPQMALDYKLVDEIMFSDQPLKVVASTPGAIPQQVINKLRNDNLINNSKQSVDMSEIANMFAQMKAEILDELKPKQPEKEPEPIPEAKPKAKRDMSRFFLNL